MRPLIVALLFFSIPAFAQVYKWTDENGNVHFGNQPPPGEREQMEIRESAPGGMGFNSGTPQGDRKHRDRSDEYDPIKSGAKAKSDARKLANDRACDLARHELESAERLLTLTESTGAYQFTMDRRKEKVQHWKSRVELHCDNP